MSAYARDYAFEMVVKEGDTPIPQITQEQLEEIKAEAAKYPYIE